MKKFLTIEISNKRIFGLDILRAMAILFVVIGHGKSLLPSQLHFLHKLFVFDGVSIFFVLSGFLIGGILIKLLDNSKPTKELLIDFWIRRWFRTLPNYFLILFLLLVFSFIYNDIASIWNTKRYFVFAQNLFYQHPKFFTEAWSLSIEEWFYLITPACIFLLIHVFKLQPKRSILIVAATILITVLLFRLFRYSHTQINSLNEWNLLFRKQVITRLDSLMYGVICAYIQYFANTTWLKYKKTLLILGVFIFVVIKILFLSNIISYTGFYNCVLSFSVTSIATALLLPYLSDLKTGSGTIHSGITMISLISYSMYLLNLSVVKLNIISKIPWADLIDNVYIIVFLKYGIYWALTIIGSILIYKYYEIPTTKLRDNEVVKKTITNIFYK